MPYFLESRSGGIDLDNPNAKTKAALRVHTGRRATYFSRVLFTAFRR